MRNPGGAAGTDTRAGGDEMRSHLFGPVDSAMDIWSMPSRAVMYLGILRTKKIRSEQNNVIVTAPLILSNMLLLSVVL